MNICGLIKTSLIDFPGKICSVIFLGGCNLQCKYCHNPSLAKNDSSLPRYKLEEITTFLAYRKNILDGVTISGGEPTTQPDLFFLAKEIRKLDFQIKLDTNGFQPQIIASLLKDNLIDYISIDIKTSEDKYYQLTKVNNKFSKILETISIIKDYDIEYELRTTCIPEYVTLEDLKKIKKSVGHTKKYYLQQFVNSTPLLDTEMQNIKPYSEIELKNFLEFVKTFSDVCEIRY